MRSHDRIRFRATAPDVTATPTNRHHTSVRKPEPCLTFLAFSRAREPPARCAALAPIHIRSGSRNSPRAVRGEPAPRQGAAHLLAVVEVPLRGPDDLVVLVSLPGDQHDVTLSGDVD